jgi:hypothetical protein
MDHHSPFLTPTSRENLSRQDLYPHRAGEERDSGQKTMGVGLTTSSPVDLDASRKTLAPGPLPPWLDRHQHEEDWKRICFAFE